MDKLKDAIYGFAIGDALGVPYEFRTRDTFRCTTMRGNGTWNQPTGTWSDDTSMTLATLDSLRTTGGIDPQDMMQRFYNWYAHAEYTCNGNVFDIGGTTKTAIERYARGVDALECGGKLGRESGNGSLMRILPLAFFSCTDADVAKVSSLTHAHATPVKFCVEYVKIARKLLSGDSINETLGDFTGTPRADIRSTGYVVDTFYAALWCLANTNNYADCVLAAVNLGDDTDTIAAVAGGLAGIAYGFDSVPQEWIDALRNKALIDSYIADN